MTEKKSSPRGKSAKLQNKWTCGFCSKEFAKEQTLITHSCVRRNRENEKTSPHIRIAFQLFEKFWSRTTRRKDISWEDFATSRYYNDFAKVGMFFVDTNPINPIAFMNYLITSDTKIDRWSKKETYRKYLESMLRNETPDAAIGRNLRLMGDWAEENNEDWRDFFDKVSPNRAVMWLESGRLSPWMIYLCDKSNAMLGRFNQEHWDIAAPLLDPDFWAIRMSMNEGEVTRLRGILKEQGL